MRIEDLWGALRRSWWIVLIGIALGLAGGLVATTITSKVYVSETQVFVSTRTTGTIAELQQGEVFAEARAQSLVILTTSQSILQPVIDELDLKMTLGQLTGMVSASSTPSTPVVTVKVSAGDPKLASDIAAKITARLKDDSGTLDPTTGKTSPVSIVVLSEATTPTDPSSPNRSMNLALGGFVGFAVGLIAALIRGQRKTLPVVENGLVRVEAPKQPRPPSSASSSAAAKPQAQAVKQQNLKQQKGNTAGNGK
ncbi:capsular polysaccharide biosynthesis protein [Psychromicrobium silvestre]|uniref:Capsular polysaccharide biosynthesis protein n=1 Tax=Psychromicrobium silvestre TaxID=1645614 RepID=A0A7Y9LS53_9MICC|nr:Wzz/FepE/Etk N-terminal domain-containing protein [Psychromicrobium silvestre]NYE94603.1 capsular polysaccharide biosynthesis protein [Psychromicrobium silvestre]